MRVGYHAAGDAAFASRGPGHQRLCLWSKGGRVVHHPPCPPCTLPYTLSGEVPQTPPLVG